MMQMQQVLLIGGIADGNIFTVRKDTNRLIIPFYRGAFLGFGEVVYQRALPESCIFEVTEK